VAEGRVRGQSATETQLSAVRGCSLLLVCLFASSHLVAQDDLQVRIQGHYQRGQDALRQNRYEEAANEFLNILHLNPKLAEAHANLGVVYYSQGKYSEASKSFREALKLKPSLSNAEGFLGICEAKSGQIEEALPRLERAFKNTREEALHQQIGLQLIEVYHARRDFNKALDVLRSLQQAYPSNPEILYIAYRIHSDLGAKTLSDLVKSAPNSARLHQVTAELLESEGDFPRAIEQYRRAIEVDPKLSGIHHALGVAILHSSRDEASRLQAQREFELELAVNPGAAHSEYQLGEVYWLGSHPEEALKHFTRALELQSSFVDAQIALGKVWISQGQPAKALTFLQQAVRIDPENEVAHYRLAEAYRKLGRNQEGAAEMALFKKLREASSSIASIYRQVQQTPITAQTVEATELP
jgi:tetratricopeptide (TPR) repeat protein